MSVYLDKKTNRYYISHRVNGRQIVMRRNSNNKPFLNRKEAIKCEDETFSNCTNYFLRYSNQSLNDLTDLILKVLKENYKITTYCALKSCLEIHILTFCGNIKLKNISNELLEGYKKSLIANNKNNDYSVKRNLKLSKSIFKNISNIFGINLNTDILKIKNDSGSFKVYEYYTEAEFKIFLENVSEEKYKLMFMMLFYYGLRLGELRALGCSDINLHNNTISISKQLTDKVHAGKSIIISPKTKSSIRTYPLIDFIKDLYLKIYAPNFNDRYLFSKYSNQPIGSSTIYRLNKEISSKSNLHTIRIHDFRHSCAIYLYSNDFDSASIARWLGHESPATTEKTYIHYKNEIKDKIKDYIEKNQVLKD